MTDERPRFGTIDGVPITEDLIARLADEAEAGFAPDQLRRRGRPRLSPGDGPSAVVRVRVDDLLQRRLADRAHLEGMSVSAVVREALRAHLRWTIRGERSGVNAQAVPAARAGRLTVRCVTRWFQWQPRQTSTS